MSNVSRIMKNRVGLSDLRIKTKGSTGTLYVFERVGESLSERKGTFYSFNYGRVYL